MLEGNPFLFSSNINKNVRFKIIAMAHSKQYEISKMELFTKIFNGLQLLLFSQKAQSQLIDWALNKPLYCMVAAPPPILGGPKNFRPK